MGPTVRPRHDEVEDSEPLSSPGLAAGAATSVADRYRYDRDFAGIRTSRRRGFLFGLCREPPGGKR